MEWYKYGAGRGGLEQENAPTPTSLVLWVLPSFISVALGPHAHAPNPPVQPPPPCPPFHRPSISAQRWVAPIHVVDLYSVLIFPVFSTISGSS